MAKTIEEQSERAYDIVHKSTTKIEKLNSGFVYEVAGQRHASIDLPISDSLARSIEKAIEGIKPGQSILVSLEISK